ncbi:hypothetical protein BGZ76_007829, partial [Entomortierella beljakovae]
LPRMNIEEEAQSMGRKLPRMNIEEEAQSMGRKLPRMNIEEEAQSMGRKLPRITKPTLTCFQEIIDFKDCNDELVQTYVEKIWVGECTGSGFNVSNVNEIPTQSVNIVLYVYQVHEEGAIEEYGDSSIEAEDMIMMAHHWTLPCREFEGVWDR